MTLPARWRNTIRGLRGWNRLDGFARDLRFAVRTLRRTPSFTIASATSLALGFALTTITVAVMNAYSLASLPYPAADRLYRVSYAPPGPWEPRGLSGFDWTTVEDVVEVPVTARSETFYLGDGDFAQSARGLRVGPGFIDGLGVRATIGRSLNEADFRASSGRVAVIGHSLWRDRYGADPGVVGRTLRVEPETGGGTQENYEVVGVLAPGFYFGRDSREIVDLLVPLTSPARTYMVRLREGAPPAFAERRLTEAVREIASDLPADWSGVHLRSVHELYVAPIRPVLAGVGIASGLVLLIVCANVGVLLVLRLARRRKELAVRAALGSTRWDLARALLIEISVLGGVGLGAGLALAILALRSLAPLIELQLGRPAPGGAEAITVDGTVLLAAGGLGLVVVLSLAFLPLLMPWRHRLAETLRSSGAAATEGRSMRRLRSSLVAIEVAGALVLLVSCGLMLRSVVAMVRADLGYDVERLVRARVVLRGAGYADAPAFSRFYEQFARRLSDETGSPVVFTSWPPFVEFATQVVESEERIGSGVTAGAVEVGAGYFSALGIGLRNGRDFGFDDIAGAEPVAIVSETLAGQLWPDRGAVGQFVRTVEETPDGLRRTPWHRVVGVAADVRQTYGDTTLGDIYVPRLPSGRFGSFVMRTPGAPSSLWPALRRVAAGLDPRAVVHHPRTVESENRQLAGTRVLTGLLTGFAVLAGFLTLLGIYGVTAYAVQQRDRELAIRMALGATGRSVARLFVRESSVVVGTGLALGLSGALAAARVLESQLYAVQASDLVTLGGTAAILGTMALLAVWWPARRASSRNPVMALKEG